MAMVGIRERKKHETRSRIRDIATGLFSEHGIEAVTIEAIAAAADVGKGTIYNYFSSKEDMVGDFLLDLELRAFARLASQISPDADAGEALDVFAWGLLEAKRDHHGFVRAFLARLIAGPDMSQSLIAFQNAFDAELAKLHGRFVARGELSADLAIEPFILSFKTMHMGLTMLWALEGPPFTAARDMTRRHMNALARSFPR